MNLSNINWPEKVYKDEWLGSKSTSCKLSTLKIIDGEFKDPLESSDDEIVETKKHKKVHLAGPPYQNFQYGPGTPFGKTRLNLNTHIFMINQIAHDMNSLSSRKYFPTPNRHHLYDLDFQPSMKDITMEQTMYRNQMARLWERNVRIRLNVSLENTFTAYKTYNTNSTVNHLPEYYKLAAQITPEVNEDVNIVHVEELLTLGAASVINPEKFSKKITLSTDDQPPCPQHGISLPTSPFLSEMAECKRLCHSNNSLFALAESALVAVLDDQQSYLIPVSVNETDFGQLVCIENTLNFNALTTCEGTRKFYELTLLKTLCRMENTIQKNHDTNSLNMSNKIISDCIDGIATMAKMDLSNDMGNNLSSDEDDEGVLMMDIPDEEVVDKPVGKSIPIRQTGNITPTQTPDPRHQTLTQTPERRKSKRISDKLYKPTEKKMLSPQIKRTRTKSYTSPEKDNTSLENVTASSEKYRSLSSANCLCPGKCVTFKKLQMRTRDTNETFNIIVRCEDYLSTTTGDHIKTSVLLEKWPAAGSIKNKTILSHKDYIHPRCTLTAHVDVHDSTVLMFCLDEPEAHSENNKMDKPPIGIIHSILKTLKRLIPGDYILHHQPSHGTSIMLLKASSFAAESVSLQKLLSEHAIRAGEEQIQSLPTLKEDLMLPWQWLSIHGPLLFKGKGPLLIKNKKKGKGKKRKNQKEDRKKKNNFIGLTVSQLDFS